MGGPIVDQQAAQRLPGSETRLWHSAQVGGNSNMNRQRSVNGLPAEVEAAVVGDCSSSLRVGPDGRNVRWTAGRGTCLGTVPWRASSSALGSLSSSETGGLSATNGGSAVLHYFEVAIADIACGGSVAIGVATSGYNFSRPLGWDPGSCAVHSEDGTIFSYKCTDFYHPPSERTVLWNDPALRIDWGINDPVLSAKDQAGVPLAGMGINA